MRKLFYQNFGKSNTKIVLLVGFLILVIVGIIIFITMDRTKKVQEIDSNDVIIYTTASLSYGTMEQTSKVYGDFVCTNGEIYSYEIPGNENGERFDVEKINTEVLKKYATGFGYKAKLSEEDLKQITENLEQIENEYETVSMELLDGPSFSSVYILKGESRNPLITYSGGQYMKNSSIAGKIIIELLEKNNIVYSF